MKAAAFDYARAGDLAEAVRLLGEGEGSAKLIAGGQSLGPMLNLRLVRVGLLVDIRRLEALRTVEEGEGTLRYGALITHSEFEDGRVPDAGNGLLRQVGGGIAYRAVRNRGTLGGSLAHADPAADWISAFTALDATLQIEGPAGRRSLPLAGGLLGAFTLDLGETEILTAVEVPRLGAGARWGWHKINRKTGEFADAIGVALLDEERGFCRVVCGAVEGPPVVLAAVAEALRAEGRQAGRALVPAAVAEALPALDPVGRHLHVVAVQRAIDQVFGR
ncbi:carbon-monoxide dehydrogenase medium subunit [Tistlia consotensis]|uniref:Carbon-monoxide dehydrogenase medium subunit n=1 Tax=Tistlia consotensis USBA 355 TaxID=560819 RepID=A0A1Y6C9D0_9PROT|nr:FAD binding domain-containing protein [Tistlia consotensis]SMF48853.1 carbon-monoxide dehydrogenase medium subunit [Tistlia consotensis USBA 355]SNR80711.1 carbon-monoxide dehydrogenase medium subunit [Tistlia consotensis]